MTSAKLFILGEERELLWTSTNYSRLFWRNLLKNVDKETERMEKGEIHFYSKGERDMPAKKYKFNDAYIVYFSEIFDAESSENMQTILTISPAIQNYGTLKDFVTYWQVSQIKESEPYYYRPKQEEEDRIIYINGHFYNKDGTFEGKINEPDYEGSVDDVYVCDGKSTQKDRNGNELLTYNNTKLLKENDVNVVHEKFIVSASTIYAESSIGYGIIDKNELFAIASVHKRNKTAYGINDREAIKFRKKTNEERNKTSMIHAIAGEINALVGGTDFSNGAKQWDGAEQTHLPKDEDSSSNGIFMFKVNVMGWEITDELYKKWESIISSKFGPIYFNIPQKKFAVNNYKGMKNKDKIRLKSVAQYGLTMFWKDVEIFKPKENEE
ncbi:hypothetical protein ASF10_20435 [Flavobacterium sp. Leaf82]|uniref:type VI secretion system tube protein TssD n=1 Tax=Flavobacterium sp. Leaf82 TaxID=1736238 RepID=UPI0007015413|nr:type VI secretion system tube protein TssD [Flavobacterium sp. Leaf82]KQO32823.1 hypothetical protein ASF10_20435 [Flavobacterium sp. Leaf82]